MIIKNKIIPFGDYDCINLFGILFTKIDLTEKEINHENIHTVQFLECILLGAIIIAILNIFIKFSLWWYLISIFTFYILYCLEYLFIRCFHKKQGDAYHDVSFEEEAYAYEKNLTYLKDRKWYKWWKFVKIKSNI